MNEIRDTDLRVFVDAVKTYFTNITGQTADVSAAFLGAGDMPNHGYTGAITLAGRFRGSVYFTAPRLLLRDLLAQMGEPDTCEENLLDAVGEIANTIAGNARQRFGNGLEISVPSRVRSDAPFAITRRARPFVIRLRWRNLDAAVVVDIELNPAA